MYQRNVKLLSFGKDAVARTSALASASARIIDAADLATGELFVVTESNYVVNSTGTLPIKFKLAYKSGNGTLVFSDVIDRRTISNYLGKLSVASVEQISYIGYNGTSGSVTANTYNEYIVRVVPLEKKELDFNLWKIKYGKFSTEGTAYQTTVVDGVVANLIDNFKGEAEKKVKFERVCSHAGSASSGGIATVVNGSNYITIAESAGAANDAGKYAADASTMVAGDYLRIGGTTTSIATYKISSITNAGTALCTIKLDVAYQGTNGTVSAANMEVVTAAQALTVDWGIKCTGIAKNWALNKFSFEKFRFDITLENWGATAVTYSTGATEGSGNYQQVAELESFCQGNETPDAAISRHFGPVPVDYRTDYTFNTYYSLLSFNYSDNMITSLGQSASSLKQMVIAFGAATVGAATTGTTNTGANTSAITTLDAIIVAAGVGTAQASVL